MPVINGVYLKDFPALPSSVTDANIIPIAISGNQIAYRTTVAGIVTDARVTSKLLTGLSVTGSTILATDTILQAFGKVQNQLNGKVTSVGLTMPSAFSVANSPITSAGTLAVTAAGVASQYIRGDGALADFPTTGGGGSSVSYYLNGSVSQGTFVGNTYYEMNKTPVIGTGTDFTIGADGYIAQFITDANDPASLLIPAGNWNVEMYFSASSSGGTPSFYVEVYKYDGTTFTLLGSSSATPEGITNGTAIDIYYTSVGIPETVLTITDRLAIRVYVTHSGRTITLHTEDNHLSEIVTTFSNGLTALNGLTKQVQYLAVGTAGTDFAISSSVDTHTFNIPDAGASARGLITTGTQTFAGAKTFTGNSVFKNNDSGNPAVTFRNENASGITAQWLTSANTVAGTIYNNGLISTTPQGDLYGSAINSFTSSQLAASLTDETGTGSAVFSASPTFTGVPIFGSSISNGTYTYTLPSATGTLALTSALTGYLPLAGGTLTGALSGTSASFSSTNTATAFIPSGSTVPTNGMYLSAANTLDFATNTINRISITSAGNVGIGTTTPTNLASSYRSVCVNGSSAGFFETRVSDVSSGRFISDSNATGIGDVRSGKYLYLYTEDTERMRITSGGNVLIGTTTAGTDFTRTSCATASQNIMGLVSSDDSSGAGYIQFRNSATTSIGSITRVTTTNAVAYNTTSDKRLKKDLGIANSNIIDSVIIHDFEWIQGKTLDKGVFAQELYEVKPLAVCVGKDDVNEGGELDQPWGVDYSKLIPDLIVYCQDLKVQVQQLKAEIDLLKGIAPIEPIDNNLE